MAAQAQAMCVKDPIACAAQAISLGKGVEGSQSQHNLQPGDLAPAWRGPATVTARR